MSAPDPKFCPKCKEWRDRGEISYKASAADGLQGWCKLCQQAYVMARRRARGVQPRVKLDPEIRKAKRREYNRSANRRASRRYRQKNLEAIRARDRERNRLWREKQRALRPPKLPTPPQVKVPALPTARAPQQRAGSVKASPVILSQEMESAIVNFLNEKRAQGLSKNSVGRYNAAPLTQQTYAWLGRYGYSLTRFAVWLQTMANVTRPGDVTRQAITAWAASKVDSYKPATIRAEVLAVRAFLKWCFAEKLITTDLAAPLRLPTVKMRVQRTLTLDEVQKLLDVCDKSLTCYTLRDAAIVSLMVDSGLRASELCNLKIADLHIQPQDTQSPHYLIVTCGKGGHEGKAYFTEATAERLRAWLKLRAAQAEKEPVFISLGGHSPLSPLTRAGLSQIIQTLGQRAGVDKVTPHSFRRSFCTLMLKNGASTRVVQLLGRWKTLGMVERYSQGLDVSESYNKYAAMNHVGSKGGNV